MAFGGFLDKFTKRGDDDAEVASQAISSLTDNRKTMRVEIEQTHCSYYTIPMLRSGAVVVPTPERFKTNLETGGWLRIRINNENKQDLRVQITSARHGGTGQMALSPEHIAVLCKIPGAAVMPTKRAHDRFHTSHFKGLQLDIISPVGTYPVLDLSTTGMRVGVESEEELQRFPVGQSLKRGRIRFGSKAVVDLQDVIPRCHYEGAVGLEIEVNSSGHSQKVLKMFLDSLEYRQKGTKPAPKKEAAEDQNPPA